MLRGGYWGPPAFCKSAIFRVVGWRRLGGDAGWPVYGGGGDDELGARDVVAYCGGVLRDGDDGGGRAGAAFEGDPLVLGCDRESSYFRPFPP